MIYKDSHDLKVAHSEKNFWRSTLRQEAVIVIDQKPGQGREIYEGMIWVFPKIVGKPPKSSILIGFGTIINHPFWGTPIFGNICMFWRKMTLLLVKKIKLQIFLQFFGNMEWRFFLLLCPSLAMLDSHLGVLGVKIQTDKINICCCFWGSTSTSAIRSPQKILSWKEELHIVSNFSLKLTANTWDDVYIRIVEWLQVELVCNWSRYQTFHRNCYFTEVSSTIESYPQLLGV